MHGKAIVSALLANHVLAAPTVHKRDDIIVEHEMVTSLQQEQDILKYWTGQRVTDIDHDAYGTEPFPPIPEDELPRGAEYGGQGDIPRTVGRLLFTAPYEEDDWRDSSCTATILQSDNEATIVTASHCLKPNPTISNRTDWHRNVLFVPGFLDNEPATNFTLNRAFLPGGWVFEPETAVQRSMYDRAFAVLNLDSPAKRSARAAAGPGQIIQFEKNATDFDLVHNLGYPRYVNSAPEDIRVGTPAFTGRRLAVCYGKPVSWWRFPTNLAGFECLMGGGSSGGPHFAEFDSDQGVGGIVGVNSVSDLSGDGEMDILELAVTVNDDLAERMYDAAQAVEPILG